jgi:hypothetical protein
MKNNESNFWTSSEKEASLHKATKEIQIPNSEPRPYSYLKYTNLMELKSHKTWIQLTLQYNWKSIE